MEPVTTSTRQIFKTVLIFSLITLGINIGRRLIFNAFDLDRIFGIEIMVEITLELVFGFLTGIVTYYLTKGIRTNGLGTSLLKAFIFSIVYSFASFTSAQILFSLFKIGFGSQFDFFQSFLNFIPYGFMQGILFMLVVVHFTLDSKEQKSTHLLDS